MFSVIQGIIVSKIHQNQPFCRNKEKKPSKSLFFYSKIYSKKECFRILFSFYILWLFCRLSLYNGNVGIGTASPSQKLEVNGTALATAWNTTSDERKKENIVELSGVLDKILQLRGVSFDWKSDHKHDLGVIAQEVEKVFPEFVTTDAESWKSVDYSKLTAPLIEAIKEQQSQIATQKEEIELLKSRLDKAGL